MEFKMNPDGSMTPIEGPAGPQEAAAPGPPQGTQPGQLHMDPDAMPAPSAAGGPLIKDSNTDYLLQLQMCKEQRKGWLKI